MGTLANSEDLKCDISSGSALSPDKEIQNYWKLHHVTPRYKDLDTRKPVFSGLQITKAQNSAGAV